jgi:hypothetical protein
VISAGTPDTNGRIDLGIDTQGFTLNLMAGGSSGVWTPNHAGGAATSTVWTLSGTTNGAIRANAFVFTNSGVTTDVGAGAVLLAVGGNSTSNNLGSTGTINAGSIFRYAGAAATNTPATLTFNRNIGDLEVTSGALRLLSNAVGTVQNLRVSGGSLDLQGLPTFASSSVLNVASGATLNVSDVTGGFVVGSSQTLRGSGTVVGNTTISGTLSPGNSTGTLTFSNNLTLGGSSTSAFEINGFTTGLFDLVSGGLGSQTVTFDGALNLTFINDFSTVGELKIFDFENYSGAFDNLSTTGLAGGYSATFDSLSGTVNVVPEPSTYALLTLAAAGLGAHVLRRRRNKR